MCRNIQVEAWIQAQQNLSSNFRAIEESVPPPKKKEPSLGLVLNMEPGSFLVCCNQVSFNNKRNSIAANKKAKNI
jgi:hypothetical protein